MRNKAANRWALAVAVAGVGCADDRGPDGAVDGTTDAATDATMSTTGALADGEESEAATTTTTTADPDDTGTSSADGSESTTGLGAATDTSDTNGGSESTSGTGGRPVVWCLTNTVLADFDAGVGTSLESPGYPSDRLVQQDEGLVYWNAGASGGVSRFVVEDGLGISDFAFVLPDAWDTHFFGDFDGDDRVDLLSTWDVSASDRAIYFGMAAPGVLAPTPVEPSFGQDFLDFVLITDADGDGMDDLVMESPSDDSVTLWLSGGDGSFSAAGSFSAEVHTGFGGLAAADDGAIVVLPELTSDVTDDDNMLHIVVHHYEGGVLTTQATSPAMFARPVHASDDDGDGFTDVFVHNTQGTSFNPGDDEVEYWTGSAGGLVLSASFPDAEIAYPRDFDGDGDADLLYRDLDNDAALWFVENLGGTFGTPQDLEATLPTPGSVMWAPYADEGGQHPLIWISNQGAGQGPFLATRYDLNPCG